MTRSCAAIEDHYFFFVVICCFVLFIELLPIHPVVGPRGEDSSVRRLWRRPDSPNTAEGGGGGGWRAD